MEKKNYLNFSDKLNLKEEYKKAAGKAVPHDFFVYTCMAEDHTFQTLEEESRSGDRWPLLASRREGGSLEDPLPEKTLEEGLDELVHWYVVTYPELASDKVLDYTLCSLLIEKMIWMINDIRQFSFIKTHKSLPQLPHEGEKPEFWRALEAVFQKSMSSYAPYLMSFFSWVYAQPAERDFEISDLPPVGRYFGILKDNLRSKGGESSSSFSSSRNASQGQGQGESFRSPRRSEKDRSSEGGQSRDYREKSRSSRHENRNDDSKSGPRNDKEKLALLEVDKAILALKKHSSMLEFRLRPQNSFIRRLQHKKISELGFLSNSVGEDEDRAVLITRQDS